MGDDEGEVGVKVCRDGGGIAVAEDVGGDAGKDDNGDESDDGENAKNASVGVVWEEIVPFLYNILQPVGDEDGEREDDEDDDVGVEAGDDGGK